MSRNAGIEPKCPECGGEIAGDDVNVAKDVAYCRSCNLAHKLSVLVCDSELMAGVDFANPPSGVRYVKDGGGMTVAATHRSIGTAFGTLGIAIFWNGIVSVFVLIAIAGTLLNLDIPIPNWFPSPEMNDNPMSPGMTVFLWVFLTPFILVGLSLVGGFLMYIGGRTAVRVDNAKGTVFTGVGPLGYRRRFDASAVSSVRIHDKHWQDSSEDHRHKTYIGIETHEGKIIRFGTMLSDKRRKFVAASVRKVLVG